MERNCDTCGEPYTAQRSTSRYCSDVCRKRAQRADGVTGTAHGATLAELTTAGVTDTARGQIALALAAALDSPSSLGSAKAAIAKELAAALERAMAGVKVANDPLDELSLLRDRKRGSA